MFDIFVAWFGQGMSFPVIAVDVLFFALGLWIMLRSGRRGKWLPICLVVLIGLSMAAQFLPGYFVQILAVLVCGLCTMMLVGTACAALLLFVLRQVRKNRAEQEEEQEEET
ncbi:MAG: hypothetical protein LUE61_00775 [Clostridiales bacterium]|nr:hypothetical protein [Clostridiales bacterium]